MSQISGTATVNIEIDKDYSKTCLLMILGKKLEILNRIMPHVLWNHSSLITTQ